LPDIDAAISNPETSPNSRSAPESLEATDRSMIMFTKYIREKISAVSI
jgi:hypothetical protein